MTLVKATPKRQSQGTSSSSYNNTPQYQSPENPSDSSRWCGKRFLVIIGVIIVISIISSVIDNNSSSSYRNSSYTSSYNTTTNSGVPDGYCKGSDGNIYAKPLHSYCDGGKTPQGRVCNAGYTAKSENNETWIQSSWYCQCNKSVVSCSQYISCIEPNDLYVNQYSQSSVDVYNRKVEAYNRCLSEKCSC